MTVIAIFLMGNNLLFNIDSNSGNVNKDGTGQLWKQYFHTNERKIYYMFLSKFQWHFILYNKDNAMYIV